MRVDVPRYPPLHLRATALERVLGTSTQIVSRPDADAVKAWGTGLNADGVSPGANRIDSLDEQRLQNSGAIRSPQ